MVATLEPRRHHLPGARLAAETVEDLGCCSHGSQCRAISGKAILSAELRGTEPWAPRPQLLREAYDTQRVCLCGGGLVQGGLGLSSRGHLCPWKSVLDLFFREGALLPCSSPQSR